MTKLIALARVLAACKSHHGDLSTLHGNDVQLSRDGIASFPAQPNRCPGQNGEGDIKLTYDNGEKRVKGTCKGGVMVGDWKGWYQNGAVVWKGYFQDGFLHGD